MSASTYDAAMVRVFADEGGYTNDPKDPGGPTNWGITIFDARKYWKSDATAVDVKEMPKAIASDIYRKHYADPVRYNDLPAGFDYSVLDAGINSGIGRAIPWAARSIGIVSTSSLADIVPISNAANDKVSIIQKYWAFRLSFLHGLSTWSHFGTGWGRRCAQGEAAAVKMWLTVGAHMTTVDTRKKLDQEVKKAKTKSTNAATAGGGSAAGSAVTPAFDLSHLSGKIMLGVVIAIIAVAVMYFVRQAILHNQRAAAYAA